MVGHDVRLEVFQQEKNRNRWDSPGHSTAGNDKVYRYYCPAERRFYNTCYVGKWTPMPICPVCHGRLSSVDARAD